MRRLLVCLILGTLLLIPLAVGLPAQAAHKPHYKASLDVLGPGEWEAHIVWLRSDIFNYLGKVWWQFSVSGDGNVDVLFLDWGGLQTLRDGGSPQPIVPGLRGVRAGSQDISDLGSEQPYFLVFRNPGAQLVVVQWQIYADIDWRRWQSQEPGPSFNTVLEVQSPMLSLGESWQMSFPTPGFYIYFCYPHVDMSALVEVTPAEAPGETLEVVIREFGFHPEVIQVPQGTIVSWTNYDGLEHSVRVELLLEGLSAAQPPPEPGSDLVRWWPLIVAPLAGVAAFAGYIIWRRRRP